MFADQQPCPQSELPPCTSDYSQQCTLITLVPPCNQALLQASTEVGCLKPPSVESLNSITSCQQQTVTNSSGSEDYSYPNLRAQLLEHHNQGTCDGYVTSSYVIVQPDRSVWQSSQGHENDTKTVDLEVQWMTHCTREPLPQR